MELADAEQGYELALTAELHAQKAYEVALDNVAFWATQKVLAARPHLELVPPVEEEPEPISYADPLTHIHDLDKRWSE